MKLRIEQRVLADAARQAFRRLPTNPLQPVLAGLLLEAPEQGPVALSGFDLETATRAILDGDVLEPGDAVVSGRLLADVAASLPAGPVDVVADERELTVSTPGNAFSLPVMDRREYPALPTPPQVSGSINGAVLVKAAVHAADAAMPRDDAVGQLEGFGGVEVASTGDTLRIRSSDRYRLVEHLLEWQPAGDDGSLLIPADDLKRTAKALAGGPVQISFGGGFSVAALSGDALTVTSRTIAGAFPDIGKLFPAKDAAAGEVVVNARDLLEAVKRAALVNDKEEQPVVLEVDQDRITIRGGSEGGRGSSQVEAHTGDLGDFRIGFRPGFLASLLAPIDGAVHLWLYAPTKSALIEPAEGDTYRAVCMPVRL